MRKTAVVLGLTILAVAGFVAYAVWAFLATADLSGGWASLEHIWPYVAGGVLVVALLTGGLMWLAFYSANHGYDERIDDP